jgi:hypothetical protein
MPPKKTSNASASASTPPKQTITFLVVEKNGDIKETEIRSLIEQLYQEKKVKTVNPEAKLSEQLICLIP